MFGRTSDPILMGEHVPSGLSGRGRGEPEAPRAELRFSRACLAGDCDVHIVPAGNTPVNLWCLHRILKGAQKALHILP